MTNNKVPIENSEKGTHWHSTIEFGLTFAAKTHLTTASFFSLINRLRQGSMQEELLIYLQCVF